MKRTYVNRLPKGEDVENTNVRIGNGELIVEVEFKEKFKPKDGDFVITPYGNIYIYNSSYAISGRSYKLHGFYAGVNGFGSIIINTDFENGFNGAERLATPEEKDAFLERLEKECHKRWNPETKKLEDVRWIPNNLEKYWYITEDIEVAFAKYGNMNNLHIFRIRANNCFKTEDAAQKVADQIKEIFKNSKAE